MAKYGFVAGMYTKELQTQMESTMKNIKFYKTWDTIMELASKLVQGGLGVVGELDAILVLDGGFSQVSNTYESVSELVELQNMFKTQDVTGVKIYLVTVESDIFKAIKHKDIISDPIIYEDMYVIYRDGVDDIKNKLLIDMLGGRLDNLPSTLRMEGTRELTRNERLEQSMRKLEEESKKYEGDSGIDTFNQLSYSDNVDSPQNKAILEREDAQLRELNRRRKKEGLPELDRLPVEEEEKEEKPVISRVNFGQGVTTRKRKPDNQSNVETYSDSGDDLSDTDDLYSDSVVVYEDANVSDIDKKLKERYDRLKVNKVDISSNKLMTDKGVISFTGAKGSGTSGLVAQTGEVYASLGRKVLIVDLDIVERSQTLYFPSYDVLVESGKGLSDSLIKSTQGVKIKDCAVPVTSNIDILSISRTEVVEGDMLQSISRLITSVIHRATRQYDIVLLDVPLRYLGQYMKTLVNRVTRNVFVVENSFYSIENLFAIELNGYLDSDELLTTELLTKSVVILNKYLRGNRDIKGYELTIRKVKEILQNAGKPFDRLLVSGEIPFYEDWEKQYLTNRRRVLTDLEEDGGMTLGLYRNVISKVVI